MPYIYILVFYRYTIIRNTEKQITGIQIFLNTKSQVVDIQKYTLQKYKLQKYKEITEKKQKY